MEKRLNPVNSSYVLIFRFEKYYAIISNRLFCSMFYGIKIEIEIEIEIELKISDNNSEQNFIKNHMENLKNLISQ